MKQSKRFLTTLLVVACMCVLAHARGSKDVVPVREKTPSAAPAAQKAEDKTLTIAMVSAWDSLIPFETTSNYSDIALDLIYDKLVYLKADGTYEPRYAESVEMSDDHKVLTFHLRKDAKWNDGKPVTAKDVVFSAILYTAPSVNAIRKNNLQPFAGFGEGDRSIQVKALDDHTVAFHLSEPTNADYLLFNKFRDFYIMPEHLLGDIPLAKIREAEYWKHPIGSGPCIFEHAISGERIEFRANKNYYLKSPQWDRLVIRVVPTSNLLAGLMNGEIDVLGGNIASLQLSDWSLAKKQPNLVCASVPTVGYQYMAINTSREYLPAQVRRAINMAINRTLIVDGLLQGEGVAVWGPIMPNNIYYNPEIEEPYQPAKAKELLASAKWDANRVLVMSVPTGNKIREQSAVIIQQNLADVGIKTQIETSDFATHLNRVRKGDFDLGFIGSAGSPDPSECVINFCPTHLNNFSHLSDWAVFDAGEEGGHAFTFEERKASYDRYQRKIREQVPFAFTYSNNILFAHSTRVEGIKDVQDYSQLNRDVWNWTVK